MRTATVLAVAFLANVAAGCGSDSENSSDRGAPTTGAKQPGNTQTKTNEAMAPKKATAPREVYRNEVKDCVEGVAFKTADAGNALRVETPGGQFIANIQTFRSEREAQRFNAQVELDHAYGGKGVAVWLKDADETQRTVVADCLTP